jgi:serine/threonine-protein kinase
VFRAFDPETDRLAAIKWFALDLAPERVHQVVAELERLIAASLTHPAIAAPLATGIRENRPYLAMEYVAADSLDVALRQYGAAPPPDALRVAAQLAGALDFAAVVNIAHGALHPRDVLLSPEETRLTGIGIAHAFERINVAAPVRRPYTPPEGIAGADWDRRADVFSLAALMHEMLWGRRLSAIGAQAAASLTQIPGADLVALRTLFARALAERPADRFDTALEFAQALTLAFPDVAMAALPEEAAAKDRTAPRAAIPPQEPARLPLDEPSSEERPAAVKKPSRTPPSAELPVVVDSRHEETPAVVSPPPPSETHAHGAEPSDLELRQAEAERYQHVDSAPAFADLPRSRPELDVPVVPPTALNGGHAGVPVSALDRSRSAVWPLALALIVGVALGFAGGYGVGSRDRSSAPVGVAAAPPTSTTPESTAAAQPAPAPGAPGHDASDSPTDHGPKPSSTEANAGSSAAVASSAASAPPPVSSRRETQRGTSGSARAGEPAAVPAPKAEAASSGRLLVRSTPAGAHVFVDGRDEGLTPVAVRELARGDHRIRIVRDGYDTEERHVRITASRPAQEMTVSLGREEMAQAQVATAPVPSTPGTTGRFVGALNVDSRPPGAKVFVDGKLAGTTPLQMAGLDAGEHVVRIERDGYRRWSSSVRVVASEQNRVTASLEK